MRPWLAFTIILVLVALALAVAGGCATPATAPPAVHLIPHTTPPSLSSTATWLDIYMVIAVPVAVAGIVLFFAYPEAHRISTGLVAGGGSLFGISAVLKVSLWLVPWIAGGLGLLALFAFAYEMYVKISGTKTYPDLLDNFSVMTATA